MPIRSRKWCAFVALWPLCLLPAGVGVASEPREVAFDDRGSDVRVEAYRQTQARLGAARVELHGRWRAAKGEARLAVEREAQSVLEEGLVELMGPWMGTPWAFHGTSVVPGRGTIACGYFVTTLLRDAGMIVDRVWLARGASEWLVRTVSPALRIRRFRNRGVPAVLEWVRAQPERWFVVGLDLHVGLLVRLDDGRVRFCHASYLPPTAAVCEDAATADAMLSRYHVVGPLFTEAHVRMWLKSDPVPNALQRPGSGR